MLELATEYGNTNKNMKASMPLNVDAECMDLLFEKNSLDLVVYEEAVRIFFKRLMAVDDATG